MPLPSPTQRFFQRLLPGWAAGMEADSRLWVADCACGRQFSIWDMGGIRYKASGGTITLLKCPHCGRVAFRKLRKLPPPADPKG